MAIKYPVEVPAAKPGQQVAKARIYWTVDGSEFVAVADVPMTENNKGNGAVVVPQGSSGKAWFTYVDATGNESTTKSPDYLFTGASDETPPDGPEGALIFGKGDTVDDPSPDPFAPPAPVEPPAPVDPAPANPTEPQ